MDAQDLGGFVRQLTARGDGSSVAHMIRGAVIRHAVESDLPVIVDIYNASIPGRLATADTTPVTAAMREPWFARHSPQAHPLVVLERRAQVVGWLSFEPFYGRPAYSATVEVGVYVDPDHRRTGVATALLGEAMTLAKKIGHRTLLGFVFGHNVPSLKLFERFEFEPWGRLPGIAVLDGIERDLVILGRSLDLVSSPGRG